MYKRYDRLWASRDLANRELALSADQRTLPMLKPPVTSPSQARICESTAQTHISNRPVGYLSRDEILNIQAGPQTAKSLYIGLVFLM
jgi:hypothetical protein